TRSSGGGDAGERQPAPGQEPDFDRVVERLPAIGERGHELGDIHGAAATEADDEVRAVMPRGEQGLVEMPARRLAVRPGPDLANDAARFKWLRDRGGEWGDRRRGDDEHSPRTGCGAIRRTALNAAKPHAHGAHKAQV